MMICSHLNNCCKKIMPFLKKNSNTRDSNDDKKRGESILQFQQMSQSDLEKAPNWDQARKSSIFGGYNPRTFQADKRQSTKIKRKQTGWVKGTNPLSKKYSVEEDDDDDDDDDDHPTNTWKKSRKSSAVYAIRVSDKDDEGKNPFEKWENSKEHQIYSVSVPHIDKKKSSPHNTWTNNNEAQVYSASISSKPRDDLSSHVSGRPKSYTSSTLKYVVFIPTVKKGTNQVNK